MGTYRESGSGRSSTYYMGSDFGMGSFRGSDFGMGSFRDSDFGMGSFRDSGIISCWGTFGGSKHYTKSVKFNSYVHQHILHFSGSCGGTNRVAEFYVGTFRHTKFYVGTINLPNFARRSPRFLRVTV